MRSLHEITQQWLCRILFVVAGVLPTLAVLAWVGALQTPWHQAAFERQAAALLDLDVQLEAVAFPRPTVTRIDSLVLSDPQSERVLAEFATLEVSEAEGGWTISAGDVRISRDSLGDVTGWLTQIIQRRDRTVPERVHFVFENVQFADHNTVTTITCDWTRTDETARLNVSIAPEDADARAVMAVLYDRRDARRNIRFVLDTQSTPLPSSAIAVVAPGLKTLGTEATFQGKLWARLPTGDSHAAGRWYVDALAGQFADVDLAILTQSIGEDLVDAHADISIRGALFENGRLLKAAGEVKTKAGTLDAGLAKRLAKQFGFRSDLRIEADDRQVDFDRLAFAFSVDRGGVMIEGRANNSLAVIANEHGSIASQPSCEPLQLAEVLRAVAAPNAPLVPIATAVPWLAELLPKTQAARRQ